MKIVKILIAFILVILSFGILEPTTLLYMDFKDLTTNSDSIVTGLVRNKSAKWDRSGKFIYSEYTVDLLDSIKGENGDTIRFIVPGGRIGNVGMVIHGAPNLKENDEVLLFLNNVENPLSTEKFTIPTVTGYGMGKYSIYVDPKSGEEMVVNDLSELSIVENVNGHYKAMSKRVIKRPLKDVVNEIKMVERNL